MVEDTVTGAIPVLGIDFGIKTFAVCSDGEVFEIEPPFNFDKAAKVIEALCDHAAKYPVVAIEGLKGTDNNSRNILWFKKSMGRRYPSIQVKRAPHNLPTSRMCSACDSLHTHFRNRIFKCDDCGHLDDRDKNAAKNLRNYVSRA